MIGGGQGALDAAALAHESEARACVQRTADCRTMASWVFSTPVGTGLEYDPDDETSRAPRV
jgi:hypothetical protein